MRNHMVTFCIFAAFAAAASAQITLGEDKTKIQCVNDTLCGEQFGDMAICDFEYCDCKNGSKFHVEEGKCTEAITSFRSDKICMTTSDCSHIEDSECRFGDCVCLTDYIKSKDESRCLPLAKEVGWGCEEDLQCTIKLNKTTECRDFLCVCKAGTTISHMGSCVEAKGLEAYCSASDDVCSVTTPDSECRQGICACRDGYVAAADSKTCLRVAEGFKSPCEESIQCTQPFGQHAICSKRECVCTAGNHFSDMKCWQDKGLTERCDYPDECYIAQDGANQKLQCTAGQCICKPGYAADLGTLKCSGATTATISGLSFVLLAALLLV